MSVNVRSVIAEVHVVIVRREMYTLTIWATESSLIILLRHNATAPNKRLIHTHTYINIDTHTSINTHIYAHSSALLSIGVPIYFLKSYSLLIIKVSLCHLYFTRHVFNFLLRHYENF